MLPFLYYNADNYAVYIREDRGYHQQRKGITVTVRIRLGLGLRIGGKG